MSGTRGFRPRLNQIILVLRLGIELLRGVESVKTTAEGDAVSKLNLPRIGQWSSQSETPENHSPRSATGITTIGDSSLVQTSQEVDETGLRQVQSPNQISATSQIGYDTKQPNSNYVFDNFESDTKVNPQGHKFESSETAIAKIKEEVLGNERITETKKEQMHGQLLQQFLGGVRET